MQVDYRIKHMGYVVVGRVLIAFVNLVPGILAGDMDERT
jgi:hypothetical protein